MPLMRPLPGGLEHAPQPAPRPGSPLPSRPDTPPTPPTPPIVDCLHARETRRVLTLQQFADAGVETATDKLDSLVRERDDVNPVSLVLNYVDTYFERACRGEDPEAQGTFNARCDACYDEREDARRRWREAAEEEKRRQLRRERYRELESLTSTSGVGGLQSSASSRRRRRELRRLIRADRERYRTPTLRDLNKLPPEMRRKSTTPSSDAAGSRRWSRSGSKSQSNRGSRFHGKSVMEFRYDDALQAHAAARRRRQQLAATLAAAGSSTNDVASGKDTGYGGEADEDGNGNEHSGVQETPRQRSSRLQREKEDREREERRSSRPERVAQRLQDRRDKEMRLERKIRRVTARIAMELEWKRHQAEKEQAAVARKKKAKELARENAVTEKKTAEEEGCTKSETTRLTRDEKKERQMPPRPPKYIPVTFDEWQEKRNRIADEANYARQWPGILQLQGSSGALTLRSPRSRTASMSSRLGRLLTGNGSGKRH